MLFKKTYKAIGFVMMGLVISSVVAAQSWQFGVKGGISIPDLTPAAFEKTPVSKGFSTRLGPDAFIFTEYRLSNRFSIEMDIGFSAQGGKKHGKQAIPVTKKIAEFLGSDSVKYLYANFRSDIKLSYLMIPILGKYQVPIGRSHRWQFYTAVGPYVAWLLSATGTAKGSSQVYFDADETEPVPLLPISFDSSSAINDLHHFNFGAELNVGLRYEIGRQAFFAEGGGNYGLLILQKDRNDGQNHTGALVFRLGYAFRPLPKGRRVRDSSSSIF